MRCHVRHLEAVGCAVGPPKQCVPICPKGGGSNEAVCVLVHGLPFPFGTQNGPKGDPKVPMLPRSAAEARPKPGMVEGAAHGVRVGGAPCCQGDGRLVRKEKAGGGEDLGPLGGGEGVQLHGPKGEGNVVKEALQGEVGAVGPWERGEGVPVAPWWTATTGEREETKGSKREGREASSSKPTHGTNRSPPRGAAFAAQ
jgi:hypothetical protein